MKPTLAPGLKSTFVYVVPEDKTVPHVFAESERFRDMPHVFATAFMVGLLEWACMEAMHPHLDPGEQSVGTGIWVTHGAATPPGLTVTVDVALVAVEGRRLTFEVRAHDGVDLIGEGKHERFVIDREKFVKRVEAKRLAALGA
ncbi:MAG TPA: thioesterase family protein [Anaeromyxobacteraceae bacterium]|nr:thioesterase family protein [Anaeromyxobacteraceae bacterium]